ncbi:Uncharacterized protein FWK35_00023890 [Aphis craccivora]|uniref:ETS domain-containing protein n=1 Tax=Aphis craccivora TaxID=307492 RepID=A0A6G0W2F2_APHCR|nr:Uncharacterized protein FWK35_00023890 [Aphis craccivora]
MKNKVLLQHPQYSHIITWANQAERVFKIVDGDAVTALWGEKLIDAIICSFLNTIIDRTLNSHCLPLYSLQSSKGFRSGDGGSQQPVNNRRSNTMTATKKIDRATGDKYLKPECVVSYNANMGAIDKTDMLLIDMALLNAYSAYKTKSAYNQTLDTFQSWCQLHHKKNKEDNIVMFAVTRRKTKKEKIQYTAVLNVMLFVQNNVDEFIFTIHYVMLCCDVSVMRKFRKPMAGKFTLSCNFVRQVLVILVHSSERFNGCNKTIKLNLLLSSFKHFKVKKFKRNGGIVICSMICNNWPILPRLKNP